MDYDIASYLAHNQRWSLYLTELEGVVFRLATQSKDEWESFQANALEFINRHIGLIFSAQLLYVFYINSNRYNYAI
jgi:hypothetical protein